MEILGRHVTPLGALAGLDLRDHAPARLGAEELDVEELGVEELGVEKLGGSDPNEVVGVVGPDAGHDPDLAVAAVDSPR